MFLLNLVPVTCCIKSWMSPIMKFFYTLFCCLLCTIFFNWNNYLHILGYLYIHIYCILLLAIHFLQIYLLCQYVLARNSFKVTLYCVFSLTVFTKIKWAIFTHNIAYMIQNFIYHETYYALTLATYRSFHIYIIHVYIH